MSDQEFIDACNGGNLRKVQQLLEGKKININYKDI